MAVGMRVTARCELAVLEAVTLADLAAGHLPDSVRALTWGVTHRFTGPR